MLTLQIENTFCKFCILWGIHQQSLFIRYHFAEMLPKIAVIIGNFADDGPYSSITCAAGVFSNQSSAKHSTTFSFNLLFANNVPSNMDRVLPHFLFLLMLPLHFSCLGWLFLLQRKPLCPQAWHSMSFGFGRTPHHHPLKYSIAVFSSFTSSQKRCFEGIDRGGLGTPLALRS